MGNNAHRIALQNIARKAMLERGLLTDFPASVLAELKNINYPKYNNIKTKDLRILLWCSVDNIDSLDLDQLTYAERLDENYVKLLVAIADVDALVNAQSNIDQHASQNTTTVYTVAQIFPMLPEELSTDLTSLRFDTDRNAIVIEMIVDNNGAVIQSDIYCAIVRNHAKLEYNSLGAWLEGIGPIPPEILKTEGLAETIKLQDQIAQKMKELRYDNGALDFVSIESRPVFEGDILCKMKEEQKNRAKNMIEDFMIASNGVTAQFLAKKNYPSLRRIVRSPKRWGRIIELASENGFSLPAEADPKSLSQFLKFVKQNAPQSYPDLSHSVLKLLGGGEYVIETSNSEHQGHFGLAVKHYSHSTAPNRRYPDLITHRLLKSAMIGGEIPYSLDRLESIARHCTLKEDDANKVERQVEKSAHAMLLESRIGDEFDAIISGAAPKGTWVRISDPYLEGKLVKGIDSLQVGHKLRVRLIDIDVESGFIDFERVN